MKDISKIHVYFVPGLAAKPTIFEKIQLSEEKFTVHWLDWILPEKNESLQHYAQRMCHGITNENIVLIGVSFGGVLVQEMQKIIKVQRCIIISSVKSRAELPLRFKIARQTGLYKIIPTSLASHTDIFEKLAVGHFAKVRAKLYKKYLAMTDVRYLDWAIEKMVCWDQTEPLPGLVHIHGNADIVFPYKNIGECITVPGGTHIMIVMRYKWFNENLEEIILTGSMEKTDNIKYI
ncbi:MAG TPA: alpha/beta hydrolase [Salinimicrobium sp.]|nr:alpha/beta hydrolase [Salinimicrobium sp.]